MRQFLRLLCYYYISYISKEFRCQNGHHVPSEILNSGFFPHVLKNCYFWNLEKIAHWALRSIQLTWIWATMAYDVALRAKGGCTFCATFLFVTSLFLPNNEYKIIDCITGRLEHLREFLWTQITMGVVGLWFLTMHSHDFSTLNRTRWCYRRWEN